MNCDALFDDGAYGAQRCSRVAGHLGMHGTTTASRLSRNDERRPEERRSLAETDESPTTRKHSSARSRTT